MKGSNDAHLKLFSYNVTIYVNIFCTLMEDRISSYVKSSLTVTIQQYSLRSNL
jgi:hypothetical protein